MCSRRSAFTIIELLVVVVIIGVLLSLTVKIAGAFIAQARESATQATLSKLHSMMRTREEAFRRLGARKGFWDSQSEAFLAPYVPGSTKNHKRAITIKLMQRDLFPQRYQEVLDADRITGMKRYPTISAASNASSAEILHAFLIESSVIGDTLMEADGFSPSEVKDTDGNGLMEFVDGWGRPLRYYRWPTRFLQTPEARQMIPNLPSTLNRDQDDPLGMLASIPNFATTGIPASGNLSTSFAGPLFHDPQVYTVSLICSAGPDGIFGLKPPDETQSTTPASFGYLGEIDDATALQDDLFSIVKVGGR